MLRVMRDASAPDSRRDDMAKSAAPFLHGKISTTAFVPTENKPEVTTIKIVFVDAQRDDDDDLISAGVASYSANATSSSTGLGRPQTAPTAGAAWDKGVLPQHREIEGPRRPPDRAETVPGQPRSRT
jgi:hypothetical protein